MDHVCACVSSWVGVVPVALSKHHEGSQDEPHSVPLPAEPSHSHSIRIMAVVKALSCPPTSKCPLVRTTQQEVILKRQEDGVALAFNRKTHVTETGGSQV